MFLASLGMGTFRSARSSEQVQRLALRKQMHGRFCAADFTQLFIETLSSQSLIIVSLVNECNKR